jgi:hypothetical protein
MSHMIASILACVLIVTAVHGASAQDGPPLIRPPAKYHFPAEAVQDLRSPNEVERCLAVTQMEYLRKELANMLVAALKELSPTRKGIIEEPLHQVIEAVGVWRLEEASSSLAEIIDYDVRPPDPPRLGVLYMPGPHYPAARALVAIGGESVTSSVLNRVELEANDTVLHVSMWVLCRNVGVSPAKALIERKLTRLGAHPTINANLRRMLQFLETPNPFPWDHKWKP